MNPMKSQSCAQVSISPRGNDLNRSSTYGNDTITNSEFTQFQRLIFQIAGISLSDAKKILLVGRLSKRLKHFGYTTFSQYYQHVTSGNDPAELQNMVDQLTTNETYFFREPKHFDFLQDLATRNQKLGAAFRVWSAASSSGEEAYTIAMVLAHTLGSSPWEIVGTDISTQVLSKAQRGHYPMDRIEGIPSHLLKKFCLKGLGEQSGTMLIAKELRERVQFLQSNLMDPRKGLGQFDVIFLRNVMIYFDNDTKRKVVGNLIPYLKADGHFVIGHSESLNGLTTDLVPLRPTIYRKTDRQ